LEIKSTAADDQWSSAAGDDVFDRGERQVGETRGIRGIGARDRAEQMVRHSGTLRRGGLGAKDGKIAVKLEGIGTNDFAAVFLGERERNLRFSDGGRAGEKDGLAEDGAVGHGGRKK
jgi:hypothetical protein